MANTGRDGTVTIFHAREQGEAGPFGDRKGERLSHLLSRCLPGLAEVPTPPANFLHLWHSCVGRQAQRQVRVQETALCNS